MELEYQALDLQGRHFVEQRSQKSSTDISSLTLQIRNYSRLSDSLKQERKLLLLGYCATCPVPTSL